MCNLPIGEFETRVKRIREKMLEKSIDVFLVYGDEYRCEHLRYVSDYWPIFERAMLTISQDKDPVLLVGPEGERHAKEMSIWPDIRIAREMEMAYIPDQVDYSLADYINLKNLFFELCGNGKLRKIAVCGIDAVPVTTMGAIKDAVEDVEILNADDIIYSMRLIKSEAEIRVLKKTWQICDIGYKAILDADVIGLTEIQAAAIGEKAARDAGAESIVFSIFASGNRTNTVVGRATDKVIVEGEMIMAALAIKYAGYIATNEWPFVAGKKPSAEQKKLIDALIIAEDIGLRYLKPGVISGEVVRSIRTYFRENGFQENDLYPPIHGNGLAEAESPYPDENSEYKLLPGMGVNFDISLFGVKGVGSNRIEEGFILSDDGVVVLSGLISGLRKEYIASI